MNGSQVQFEASLPCAQCGYEVAGFDDAAVCPECRHSVGASRLVMSAMSIMRRRAMAGATVGLILHQMGLIAIAILIAIGLGTPWFWSAHARTFPPALLGLTALVFMISEATGIHSYVKFSAADSMMSQRERRWRGVTLTSVAAQLIAFMCYVALMVLFALDRMPSIPSVVIISIVISVLVIVLAGFVGRVLGALMLCRAIGMKLKDEGVVKLVNFVCWQSLVLCAIVPLTSLALALAAGMQIWLYVRVRRMLRGGSGSQMR